MGFMGGLVLGVALMAAAVRALMPRLMIRAVRP